VGLLCWLIQAYALVVFARLVFEWIPISFEHPLARVRAVLRAVTEPALRPLRALIPPIRMGGVGLDLSPLVLVLGLSLLGGVIC
jgi:YggT family protein